MSDVKRWAERINGELVDVLLAADFDALLAENARLREAGEAMAAYLAEDPCPSDVGCELCAREQPLVAAWRATTGEGA